MHPVPICVSATIPRNLLNTGDYSISIDGQIPQVKYLFQHENAISFQLTSINAVGGTMSATQRDCAAQYPLGLRPGVQSGPMRTSLESGTNGINRVTPQKSDQLSGADQASATDQLGALDQNETPMRFARQHESMSESQIGFRIGQNVAFVTENNLCTGCGTCDAACPENAIAMLPTKIGTIEPEVNRAKCTDCKLCVQVCPGFELDLTKPLVSQAALPEHRLVGRYKALYRSHTTDAEIRDRAASGGTVTQTILHMLQEGLVDGAIVVRMSDRIKFSAEGYIARNEEELKASQKSKYCPTPLNSILKQFIYGRTDERFVFVGLPSHVHGLRLLQRTFPTLEHTIPYVISTFTAHIPTIRATEFILRANIIDPSQVAETRVPRRRCTGTYASRMDDGSERFVPHLDWTYSGHAIPNFFYTPREWMYFRQDVRASRFLDG